MQENVLSVILAGGVGSRLHPLTDHRAKPAVPFGGKYRIVDFTLSNCLHSGLRRILVLTQYKSHSLQKHLRDGWSVFNPAIGEYVTVVPPQMRTGQSWYAGTADAVYQNLYLLRRSGAEHVVILSGDHIYRMDYASMIQAHRATAADATVACMSVPIAEASAFGVMAINQDRKIREFQEKPEQPRTLPDDPQHSLVSMGIYVFSCDLLCSVLQRDAENENSSHDFGKDILPQLIRETDVYAYPFGGARGRVSADGYWRDVGTIDAYFEAHMDLLAPEPSMDLYQPNWPIYTAQEQAPPARVIADAASGQEAFLQNSILGEGTVVAGATVTNSILSRNVRVARGAHLRNSIIFDDVKIGANARLDNCIVDKHVVISDSATIGLNRCCDSQQFTVSEGGVVVVPSDYRDPTPATGIPVPHVKLAGVAR